MGAGADNEITTGNALLLSDVHLQQAYPAITRRFLKLLRNLPSGVEDLFILGDLFETWIGDDAPGSIGTLVEEALGEIGRHGIRIHFMHGNRDFLIGPQYAGRAGMRLLPDPCAIRCAGRQWLLAHGDAWCIDDEPYQQLRATVRDPEWQAGFLAQPVERRRQMARAARDASRRHVRDSAADIMDVNTRLIEQVFRDYGVDRIIHGHTHRPADHDHGNGRIRHVLGDWYTQSSWLHLRGGRIERHGEVIGS